MAEDFNSFSDESAKNIESIKSSMLSIQDSARLFDKALRDAGNRTADYRKEFNRILDSSREFNEVQEKAKTNSKGITDALKQQNIQFSVIKNLNNQIDILYVKASKSTGSIKYNLEKQANALSAARDNAVELSKEYGNLATDSSKLNRSTAFFSGLSNIAKDIPGLRQLSGPFEAAAKASRETVLSNAKLSGLTKEMLGTGKGLTAEKIKELGLEKQAAGLTGSAAAKRLRDAGVTAAPKSQLVAGLQGGLTSAVSSMKNVFSSGGWVGLLVQGAQMLIEAMFAADKQVTDIAKNFNISKDSAYGTRDAFTEIADSAGNFAKIQEGNLLLQKEIVDANIQINNLLGTSVDLSKTRNQEGAAFVTQFANATKFLALSDEEQKGLLDTTAATGKEIDDINTTVLGTTKLKKLESGVLINERKILKDVLTLNNANKLTIKGGAEGLASAAFAAAKLGSNLKTVEGISKSLLQFEDSITSEIEAELLLGKEFNFEVARAAALFGDLETVAKEVTNQIGSAGEFSRMNVIQQEALAKTFGLQRDELADILVQQENLNKTRGAYVSLGEETIQQLKDTGKIEDAVFKRIKAGTATAGDYFKVLKDSESILEAKGQSLIQILGDESLASLQAQDAQSKFNDALEKAKEIFSTLVDGEYLNDLANATTDFVIALSQGKGIISQAFFGSNINETDRLNYKRSQLEKKRSSTTDANEQKQINAQIAEVDEKLNAISENKAAKEIESNSGMNVLRGPKFAEGGIITKPVYNATIGEAGKEAVLPLNEFYSRIDNTKMVTLLEKLIATVEKGGNVYVDGTLVGNTTVMANSKMGSS
jgi:hypothetical protein